MGAAECVASITASTTGAATRAWALFTQPGELRRVEAYVVGGTKSARPKVYIANSVVATTPTYVTSFYQNGVAQSTQAVLVGGTYTATPDPAAVVLQDYPQHTTEGMATWQYTWPVGEGPKINNTYGGPGSTPVGPGAVVVVLEGTGAATSTARLGINVVWEPLGA